MCAYTYTHKHIHTRKKKRRDRRGEEKKGGRGRKEAEEVGKRKERTGTGERLMRFIDSEQSEISKFCSESQYTKSVLRQPIKVLFPMSGVLLILWEASLIKR